MEEHSTLEKGSNIKVDEEGSKVLKGWIIALLIISTVGIVIYDLSIQSENSEYEDTNFGEVLGRLMIEIGLMVSAILLIGIGLSSRKRDPSVRFGCLLLSGVLIAFMLMTFF
jgi:hypothetical protein